MVFVHSDFLLDYLVSGRSPPLKPQTTPQSFISGAIDVDFGVIFADYQNPLPNVKLTVAELLFQSQQFFNLLLGLLQESIPG